MAHKSKPRDSCGGAKSCGANLLAVGTTTITKVEPFLQRNLRAVGEVFGAYKVSRDLTK